MVRVRASSLPDLFDCPARWAARNIERKFLPASSNAALGKAIHASTGAFDSAAVIGSPITVDEAAAAAVDALHRPDEDIDWGEDSVEKSEKVALALHSRYCHEIAPGRRYIAVEALCESLDISDLGITLTGTIDRVRETADGELGIADLKSGKSAVAADGTVKTQGHGLQLAVYELLAEVAIQRQITAPPQIIGLQTGLTEKGQRVGVGQIDSPRDALIGTPDTPGALQHAANFIKSGAFYGNPRSQLCSGKYCPVYATCNFRK